MHAARGRVVVYSELSEVVALHFLTQFAGESDRWTAFRIAMRASAPADYPKGAGGRGGGAQERLISIRSLCSRRLACLLPTAFREPPF